MRTAPGTQTPNEVLAAFCDSVRLRAGQRDNADDVLRRYVAVHMTRVAQRDVFAHHIDSNAGEYDSMVVRTQQGGKGVTPVALYHTGRRAIDPATFVLAAQHTAHVPGAPTLEAFLDEEFPRTADQRKHRSMPELWYERAYYLAAMGIGVTVPGFDALCDAIETTKPAIGTGTDTRRHRLRERYRNAVNDKASTLTRDIGLLIASIEVPPECGLVIAAVRPQPVAVQSSAPVANEARAHIAWEVGAIAQDAPNKDAFDSYRKRALLPASFDPSVLVRQVVLNALGVPIQHAAMRAVTARSQRDLPVLTAAERAQACVAARALPALGRPIASVAAADCPLVTAAAKATGRRGWVPGDAVAIAIDPQANLSPVELRRYAPLPAGTCDEKLVNAIAGL